MSNRINHWKELWGNKKAKQYLIICVSVAVVIAIAQPILVDQTYSDAKIIELIKAIKEASLYFGSSIATASATTLALMLTLLSMTHQADKEFDRSTYRGIQLVAFVFTLTFIISISLLLCLSLPIGEFSSIPANWYKTLYYIIVALNGVMTSLVIYGVLILFEIIRGIILKIAPDIS